MKSKNPNTPPYYLFQLVSAALGIALSLYLLIQHTRLNSGIQDSSSFCSVGKFANCDVVNASYYSEILGIPLASLGAAFYGLLFLLGLLSPPGHSGFSRTQSWMGKLVILGLAFDVFLLANQVFALKTVCLFCLGTYLCSIAHFILNIKMNSLEMGTALSLKNSLFPKIQSEKVFENSNMALAAFAYLSFLGGIALAPSAIWVRSDFYSFVSNAVEQFYQNWKSLPAKNINIQSTDAFYGNPSSKVKIIEISDFECPFCRKAAFTFHTVLPAYRNRVVLYFKHYPLDRECNPGLSRQMHPNACKLAKLSFCANEKGKFWEFHDLVFFEIEGQRTHPSWDEIVNQLRGLFSQEEISECLMNPKAAAAIEEDIRTAKEITLKGTPGIFINGKEISIPLTVETLKQILELELSQVSG